MISFDNFIFVSPVYKCLAALVLITERRVSNSYYRERQNLFGKFRRLITFAPTVSAFGKLKTATKKASVNKQILIFIILSSRLISVFCCAAGNKDETFLCGDFLFAG